MKADQRAQTIDRLGGLQAMRHRGLLRRAQWIIRSRSREARHCQMLTQIALIDVGPQRLPEFLGYKRHERMEQAQQLIEAMHQYEAGGVLILTAAPQRLLGQFDVPVTELVPDEIINARG